MKISFADIDPRHHLGARFALLLGSAGLVFGLVAALMVGLHQRSQLESSSGQGMRREATLLSRALNVAVHERGQHLIEIATQPILSSGLMEDMAAQQLIDGLHSREPDWQWLALLNTDGQLLAVTGNQLPPVNPHNEGWFAAALKAPWAGVRQMPQPAGSALMPAGAATALAPLVLAMPVVDFRGRTIMVLAGQLPIDWLRAQHAILYGPGRALPGSDSLVLDGSGRVLDGPPVLRGRELQHAGFKALEKGASPAAMAWPDGKEYLTALGRDDNVGSGFNVNLGVVLRQPAALAFDVATQTERRIVLAGVIGTLLFMALSLWLARRTTQPLQALSAAAAGIRAGGAEDFSLLAHQHRDEVGELARSLQALHLERGRRMNEERVARERFEGLFKNAPIAISLIVDHHIVMVNQAALTLFGASDLTQLVGKRTFDLVHPDDLHWLQPELVITEKAARQIPEHRLVALDGAVHEVQVMAIPVEVDGVCGWQVVHLDVTDSNRRQRELREREAQLAKVSQMAKVGGWSRDFATGRILRTEEFLRMIEASDECQLNFDQQMQSLFMGADRARLQSAIAHLYATGNPFDIELDMHVPSGSIKRVHVQGEAVFEDSRIVRLQAIVQDITELHQVQQALRALNAELEQRVAERTAQLQAANAELDSFAYAVSHDLRAPLRAVSGFSQALIEDHSAHLDGEAQGYLSQIIQASHRMGDLIDGLLALSRITRNEPRLSDVDLSAMAEAIIDDLRRGDPARQVRVEIEPGLHARGDPRMLSALLQNLLDNAWKYSLHTQAAKIGFTRERRGTEDWFSVSDNGAGFNMAYAGRLFKAFSRLHRQDEFEGIGIGLATVQRIVHRHGGKIEAEGALNQGATFRFTLPDADQSTHSRRKMA